MSQIPLSPHLCSWIARELWPSRNTCMLSGRMDGTRVVVVVIADAIVGARIEDGISEGSCYCQRRMMLLGGIRRRDV
jgi:hypothetical protein